MNKAFIFTIATSIFDYYSVNTFGARIKKSRLEKKLYQRELAYRLNVCEGTILNWERNITKPSNMMHIKGLGKLLGIDYVTACNIY
ncbi:helix-turn-helix domain-containing protein [bacterium]|nr:helix-turn-helix domain-containing protein [bacterium]